MTTIEKNKAIRFGPLDGARGIAVLIVFFSHTSGRDMFIHPQLNFAGIGHIGVYLFFCLSAYFLASKLFEEGISWNTTKQFYIKRLFRILPLYFTVITAVFVSQHFFGHYNEKYLHIKNGLIGYLQHIFLYRGDSVFWSVVVEEQFYLLVPIWIFLFIKYRIWSVIVFAVFGMINFLLYISKYLKFPWDVDYIKYVTTNDRSSGNYLDIFIYTIIFIYFFHYYKPFFVKHSKLIIKSANILFILLITYSVYAMSMNFLGFERPNYKFRYLSLLYTLVFTLFIISIVLGNSMNKYLNIYWLRKVGVFGFSIYLLHMFIFEIINLFDIVHYLKFIIACVLVFSISALTYYLIEKPSIKLSYKIINKLKLNEYKNQNK